MDGIVGEAAIPLLFGRAEPILILCNRRRFCFLLDFSLVSIVISFSMHCICFLRVLWKKMKTLLNLQLKRSHFAKDLTELSVNKLKLIYSRNLLKFCQQNKQKVKMTLIKTHVDIFSF